MSLLIQGGAEVKSQGKYFYAIPITRIEIISNPNERNYKIDVSDRYIIIWLSTFRQILMVGHPYTRHRIGIKKKHVKFSVKTTVTWKSKIMLVKRHLMLLIQTSFHIWTNLKRSRQICKKTVQTLRALSIDLQCHQLPIRPQNHPIEGIDLLIIKLHYM